MTVTPLARRTTSTAVRLGAWLLPIGALVPVLMFTLLMTSPDPTTDLPRAVDFIAGPVGLGAGILYILALIALLFGLQALHAWLASHDASPWPLAGMVLCVIAIALLIAAFGAFVLASAVAAEVYKSGQTGAADVLMKLSGGDFGTAVFVVFIAAMVVGLVGAVANGVALWRSPLPAWVAVLFAVGFVLLVLSIPIISHIGGILLAIAGGWIARTVGHALPHA